MANTYVTDLRHYLDDTEDLADMPGPALNLAMTLTSIVAWATDHEPEDILPTNVWCWRRPGRKRCRGELVAELPVRLRRDRLALSDVRREWRDSRVGTLPLGPAPGSW